MRKVALAVAVLWALQPARASAWYSFGHMEVAAVAWGKLTPAAKQATTTLLKLNPMYQTWLQKASPDDDQQTRDEIAFIMAATWPDEIKDSNLYMSDGAPGSDGNRPPAGPEASQNIGYADHNMHKYWHFIDTPFSTDRTKTVQPTTPNAQTQIAAFRATLSDPRASSDVKSYDLAWLLHLVGDVHQPLHATSRFTKAQKKGDSGGNLVKITCGNLCSDSELHFFWDDLPGSGDDPKAAANAVDELPDADPQFASIADEHVWINESFAAAKKSVYSSPIGPSKGPYTITHAYKDAASDLAKQQIALAGSRLANLLNAALK